MTGSPEHRYDRNLTACICGGEATFFEDGDDAGYNGEGCRRAGLTWKSLQRGIQPLLRCDFCLQLITVDDELVEYLDAMPGEPERAHGECADNRNRRPCSRCGKGTHQFQERSDESYRGRPTWWFDEDCQFHSNEPEGI